MGGVPSLPHLLCSRCNDNSTLSNDIDQLSSQNRRQFMSRNDYMLGNLPTQLRWAPDKGTKNFRHQVKENLQAHTSSKSSAEIDEYGTTIHPYYKPRNRVSRVADMMECVIFFISITIKGDIIFYWRVSETDC